MRKSKKVVLLEELLVDILARLSLKSIARLRSVCKEWKSIIDSDFFRDFYESENSTSSMSWSIMNIKNITLSLEIIGHHGCERWGLTSSLGSSIRRYNSETTVRKVSVLNCTNGLVLLYSETSEGSPMYHVGNPLLQQWVRIPLPPNLSVFDVVRLQENRNFTDTGLVTKMEKGIAVGYKVVWSLVPSFLSKSNKFTFMIYSSETGVWETKKVPCDPRVVIFSRLQYSIPLNGTLHWLASTGNRMINDLDNDLEITNVLSYDFYDNGGGGDDDRECRVITFPVMEGYELNQRFKKTITTSEGSLVYCTVFNDNGSCTIKVWRLVKYCNNDPKTAWKLSWELNTNSPLPGFGTDHFPVVMHPFKSEIIYLWSRDNNGLVLLNLRTHKFSLHEEEDEKENKSMDGCIMGLSGCKKYMDYIYRIYDNPILGGDRPLYFSQFVLPRWLNPLPQLSSS